MPYNMHLADSQSNTQMELIQVTLCISKYIRNYLPYLGQAQKGCTLRFECIHICRFTLCLLFTLCL